MVTEEQKRLAKISLLKEAVEQLTADLGRVKTDHGRTSIISDLTEYEYELKELTSE